MKLSQHGYQISEHKEYRMSFGELIGTACQAVIKAGRPEMQINLVDTYEGTVGKWAGVVGIMTHDWDMDWKVTVYQMAVMTSADGTDYLKVIFDGRGEDDEE